ncbi:membralin [Trichonephila clavata]|uniref:Membralin n=1 Tax=Trichonephila clavata TaxID=2740835 RepID=A0A8X6HMT4_TRICU|nr:membralin [Trichonephila clavata]
MSTDDKKKIKLKNFPLECAGSPLLITDCHASSSVPKVHRKLIEFFLLLTALFCFILLIYVHRVFVQTPITCLEQYRGTWRNNGILRVEVLTKRGKGNYTLEDSYWKEKTLRLQQYDGQSHFLFSDHTVKTEESDEVIISGNESIREEDALDAFNAFEKDDFIGPKGLTPDKENSHKMFEDENYQPISEDSVLTSELDPAYIMEFSMEYGYLRLRPSKRKELNISVTFVILDPEENTCFGGSFNRFLLNNFLGYDNVLLASIKNMAEKKDQKGFVRNAVMEIEYLFINNWTNDKSLFTAAFIMIIFTLTISTLLRHSHHQIFIVVANFFDVVWPRNFLPTSGAPVLTVILALVGMEAVMSDFFHDRSIALHIIVIVWFADLYDAVCCQSALSKRHWYKFFYLYHFLFYAYNYKFSGVYWPLTLLTSWLFTFHSMVFFFHHYELPRFLHRAARVNVSINPNNSSPPQNNPSDNNPSDNQDSAPDAAQHSDESGNAPSFQLRNRRGDVDQSPGSSTLVTDGTALASGLAAPRPVKKKSSFCCEECRVLQLRSHNCNPDGYFRVKKSIVSATKIHPLGKKGAALVRARENNGLKTLSTFNKLLTSELHNLSNSKFLKMKNIEGRSVEKIRKEVGIQFARLRRRCPAPYLITEKDKNCCPFGKSDLFSKKE